MPKIRAKGKLHYDLIISGVEDIDETFDISKEQLDNILDNRGGLNTSDALSVGLEHDIHCLLPGVSEDFGGYDGDAREHYELTYEILD